MKDVSGKSDGKNKCNAYLEDTVYHLHLHEKIDFTSNLNPGHLKASRLGDGKNYICLRSMHSSLTCI